MLYVFVFAKENMGIIFNEYGNRSLKFHYAVVILKIHKDIFTNLYILKIFICDQKANKRIPIYF